MSNDEFNANVLRAIHDGHNTAWKICTALRVGGGDRGVERALQRLRKAGKVEYSGRNGWTVTPMADIKRDWIQERRERAVRAVLARLGDADCRCGGFEESTVERAIREALEAGELLT